MKKIIIFNLFLLSVLFSGCTSTLNIKDAKRFEKGNVQNIHTWVTHGGDVNSVAKNGQTPLLIAVKNGHFDLVKQLVENGADINKKNTKEDDFYSKTPLELSYTIVTSDLRDYPNKKKRFEYLKIFRYLISYGANTEIKDENWDDRDVEINKKKFKILMNKNYDLIMDAKFGSASKLKTDLKNKKLNVNFEDYDENTALDYALNQGEMDKVKILVNHGAKGLYVPCSVINDINYVKYLVKNGAKIDQKRNGPLSCIRSKTPNEVISYSKEIITYLVKHGAKINTRDSLTNRTPLNKAISFWHITKQELKNRIKLAKLLLKLSKPNTVNPYTLDKAIVNRKYFASLISEMIKKTNFNGDFDDILLHADASKNIKLTIDILNAIGNPNKLVTNAITFGKPSKSVNTYALTFRLGKSKELVKSFLNNNNQNYLDKLIYNYNYFDVGSIDSMEQMKQKFNEDFKYKFSNDLVKKYVKFSFKIKYEDDYEKNPQLLLYLNDGLHNTNHKIMSVKLNKKCKLIEKYDSTTSSILTRYVYHYKNYKYKCNLYENTIKNINKNIKNFKSYLISKGYQFEDSNPISEKTWFAVSKKLIGHSFLPDATVSITSPVSLSDISFDYYKDGVYSVMVNGNDVSGGCILTVYEKNGKYHMYTTGCPIHASGTYIPDGISTLFYCGKKNENVHSTLQAMKIVTKCALNKED